MRKNELEKEFMPRPGRKRNVLAFTGTTNRKPPRAEATVVDVLSWAQDVDIGTRVTYGYRHNDDMARPANMNSAMKAHQEGLVFLAQRRDGRFFCYEATRISAPTAKILKLLDDPRYV